MSLLLLLPSGQLCLPAVLWHGQVPRDPLRGSPQRQCTLKTRTPRLPRGHLTCNSRSWKLPQCIRNSGSRPLGPQSCPSARLGDQRSNWAITIWTLFLVGFPKARNCHLLGWQSALLHLDLSSDHATISGKLSKQVPSPHPESSVFSYCPYLPDTGTGLSQETFLN